MEIQIKYHLTTHSISTHVCRHFALLDPANPGIRIFKYRFILEQFRSEEVQASAVGTQEGQTQRKGVFCCSSTNKLNSSFVPIPLSSEILITDLWDVTCILWCFPVRSWQPFRLQHLPPFYCSESSFPEVFFRFSVSWEAAASSFATPEAQTSRNSKIRIPGFVLFRESKLSPPYFK